jgi:lysosomal acid lipase/cholesteryl ester hydrolase
MRSNSIGSNLSFADKGLRGISLGAGKAVSGVSKGVETVGNMTTSSDDAGSSGGRKRGKR